MVTLENYNILKNYQNNLILSLQDHLRDLDKSNKLLKEIKAVEIFLKENHVVNNFKK